MKQDNICQIKNINEIGAKTPFFLKMNQFFVITLRKFRIPLFIRKFKKFKTSTLCYYLEELKKILASEHTLKNNHQLSSPLSPNVGDLVRVRSKEQIKRTLDQNNKLEGCVFMDEMWQYCGNKFKVIKRVEYFFDEAKFRMGKTRNIVLLEGLHCSGKIFLFNHRCDRNCYYFWKEAWLEMVD